MGLREPLDRYLREAILLSCLVSSLADSRTKKGKISVITMYLQAHVDSSLLSYMYNRIANPGFVTDWSSEEGNSQIVSMLEEAFTTDDDSVLDAHMDGDWSSVLDSAFTDWKNFRHSKLMKSFSRLTTIIVSAGLCSASAITFKLGDVAVFAPCVEGKQVAAADVFEAFFETVLGFVKGGWRVFRTGSLSSFYRDSFEFDEFDALYNTVRKQQSYALAGNLADVDTNENDYDLLLEEAIRKGETLLKKSDGKLSFERNYVSVKLDKIRDYSAEFIQTRTKGGLRKSPFSISLFGSSGSGKSSLTKLSLRVGLLYNKLDEDDTRWLNWADNDKFASGMRSHIQAVIFDDFANTVATFQDFSPAYRLIQVINNVKYMAPMADLHLKGKVGFNPYFCIVTTNVKDLKAVTYSNEPESVLRRLYHVTVYPRPEFCAGGKLSDQKVIDRFGITATPDVWLLHVQYYDVQNSCQIYPEAFKTVVFEGRLMTKVNIFTYLRWVQKASKAHFRGQDRYLASQGAKLVCDPITGFFGQPVGDTDFFQGEEGSEPGDPIRRIGKDTKDPEFEALEAEIYEIPEGTEEDVLEEHAGGRCADYSRPTWKQYAKAFGVSVTLINAMLVPFYFFFFFDLWRSRLHRSAHTLRLYGESVSVDIAVRWTTLALWWESFDCLPESWIFHPYVINIGLVFWKREIQQALFTGIVFIWICMASLMLIVPLPFVLLMVGLFATYTYVTMTMRTYKALVRNRIRDCKGVVKCYLNILSWKHALLGAGAIAALTIAYRRHRGLVPHANLEPKTIKEVFQRNDESNPWLVPEVDRAPVSVQSASTTSDNLAHMLKTNMVGITSSLNKTTLGFFICSNILIVPKHFIDYHRGQEIFDIPFTGYRTGKGPNTVGHSFSDKMVASRTIHIPKTDFALVYTTNAGVLKDFRSYLPLNPVLGETEALLVSRGIKDQSTYRFRVLFEGTSTVAHTAASFVGGYYNTPLATHNGMCMSPLISDEMAAVIIGFHLGGKGTRAGCGILSQRQVEWGLREMKEVDGVVLTASMGNELKPHMGDFPAEVYGKALVESLSIHRKSPTRFLEEGANVSIFGSTFGRVKAMSSVVPTVISASVTKIMGVPQQWGPPKFRGKDVYPFQASLQHSSNPCKSIGSVLDRAVACYKNIAKGLSKKFPDMFANTRPNTDIEALCGKLGERFNDTMNWSTSPGFGLHGKKSDYAIELDPRDYPEIGRPRTVTPEIWESVAKAKEDFRNNKRHYFIWKACLKDEPTKLGKDKVRVFQSAPITAQILIRMYFLPIIRLIQLFPLQFECAVGINAISPEWEQMWCHAVKMGQTRILAGDYSKYDLRMSAQLTIAAFDVLISIARLCPMYTQDDLLIMEMIVSEIVYPVIAYNGDLIEFYGTNPSGQNLTVIINSVVNSLLLRSAFYSICTTDDNDFKENCTFITYGDDVMGSVSKTCKAFNHISYASWLKEHDIVFTMPDKESEPREFMDERDCDFLKRRNHFNPDLGSYVGVLDENSIFKRLHAHLTSKFVGPRRHSVVNMADALSDWFFYGRSVYEKRQQQLLAIAEEHDMTTMCQAYGMMDTYDERVVVWKYKYAGGPPPAVKEVETLEPQCGGETYPLAVDITNHCIGDGAYPWFPGEKSLFIAGIIINPIIIFLITKGTLVVNMEIGRLERSWSFWLLVFFCMDLKNLMLVLFDMYLLFEGLPRFFGGLTPVSPEYFFIMDLDLTRLPKRLFVRGLNVSRHEMLKRLKSRRIRHRPVPKSGY